MTTESEREEWLAHAEAMERDFRQLGGSTQRFGSFVAWANTVRWLIDQQQHRAGAAACRESELRALADEWKSRAVKYGELAHVATNGNDRRDAFSRREMLYQCADGVAAILDAAPAQPERAGTGDYVRGLKAAADLCVDFEMALREHPDEFRDTFDNPGGDAAEAAKTIGDRLDEALAAAGGAEVRTDGG